MRAPLPPSLYAETAIAPVETPTMDGDRRVSVAVIGGGFTGLSTALHLAEQGVAVTVLEANEPGWGASGRNGGQVNPGLKHNPDQVEADFGADLGSRMIALSGNAPNVVFDLVQRHQINCEAVQSGTLRAAFQRRTGDGVRETGRQWIVRGAPAEILDADACRQVTGTDRYGVALLDRRGGQLNPLSYARGLARAAMQAGAQVHGGTRATAVRKESGLWRIDTPTGVLRADKLVVATNGYTDDLWPSLRRSIVPVYSAIAATEPLPDSVARAITPTRSVLYEMGEVTVYYRLDRQGRLLMGGRSVQGDVARPEPLQYLITYAEKLWPAVRGARWTHGWSGQIAATTDHYPHVHEPDESVMVCLGYNGRGVAMSSAMGPELARRAIGGAKAAFNMPVTGIRTIPFHALWKQGVQARVAYGRIRDWLGI